MVGETFNRYRYYRLGFVSFPHSPNNVSASLTETAVHMETGGRVRATTMGNVCRIDFRSIPGNLPTSL